MNKIITLVSLCFMLTLSNFAQSNSIEQAPSITLKDLKGKMVSLKDFKGKVVLLNFWATWCVPCKAEIPELVKWQKEYRDEGLQVIGVTFPPTSPVNVRSFARKLKVNYPVLFGSKKTKQLFDSSRTLPFTVVIDKAGNIKARIEGVIFAEEFDEKVKPLLETANLSPEPNTK